MTDDNAMAPEAPELPDRLVEPDKHGKRMAVLRITPHLFIKFCQGLMPGPGRYISVDRDPLPEDAVISETRYNEELGVIEIVISSDNVMNGEILRSPVIRVTEVQSSDCEQLKEALKS